MRPPAVRPVLNAVAGYRRPFPTFADAAAAIAGDEGGGHSNPGSIGLTVRDAKKARPSDYPALFYIQGLLPQIRASFISTCQPVDGSLSWPSKSGSAELAKERNEQRGLTS
jgi:hypothetical protein